MADVNELIEQLEDVDPAEIDKEIASLQDRIDRLRLVRCWLTGEKPPKFGKRGPRTPRQPREQAARTDRPEVDRSVDPKKRVIAHLTAAGPTGWTKLLSVTGLSPQQLSDVLKGDERTFRKRDDGLWELRRP